METSIFKQNIVNLLAATKYSLNLKPDQISSLEVHSHLKPLFDWISLNISEENCITNEELNKFEQLEESGKVLYNEELDEALNYYNDQIQDENNRLLSTELFSENIKEEIVHAEEELCLKRQLLTTIKNSTSAIRDSMCKVENEKTKAKSRMMDVLKELFQCNRIFNEKLSTMKQILDELREKLCELDVNEVSADEGIDTLRSDKLNSSLWSVSSLQSVSSSKGYCTNFFCQLPFHQYEEQQKHFCKLFEKLARKKAGKYNDGGVEHDDVQLELLYKIKRLRDQKQSYVKAAAELEGIKAGREKLREIHSYLQRLSSSELTTKLRQEVGLMQREALDLSDEIAREEDEELREVCEKWAECEVSKPMCDVLEENLENYRKLLSKLDEVKQVLRVKLAADALMMELLWWEEQRVEASVNLYTRVQETIGEKVATATTRLEVMEANNADYEAFCSLPIEDRCGLIQWLAAMVGSDRRSVPDTVRDLDRIAQQHHETWVNRCYKQVQTILAVEHEMKDLYNKEIEEMVNSQNKGDPALYQRIRDSLEDVRVEMDNALSHCMAMQNGSVAEEDSEVQELLKKLISSYTTKQNGP